MRTYAAPAVPDKVHTKPPRGQFKPQHLGNLTDGAPLGIKSYIDGAVKFPSVVNSEEPPFPLCFVAGNGLTVVAFSFEQTIRLAQIRRTESIVVVEQDVQRLRGRSREQSYSSED
ncbi:hypothetical protein HG530_007102 [Fusarium avenaceum]|nr:hypothetical protein HG530_007102 [Fusarium avenaceum]